MAHKKTKELKQVLQLARCIDRRGGSVKVHYVEPYVGRMYPRRRDTPGHAISWVQRLTPKQITLIEKSLKHVTIKEFIKWHSIQLF